MSEPTYDQVTKALEHLNPEANPSEVHGLLCGFISAGTRMDGKSWIESIIGHGGSQKKNQQKYRAVMLDLYQISFEKLQNFEFDFALLLPDDEEPLSVRAKALSFWCQGYLTGMSLAGIDLHANIPEDCRESIQHITEIAKLDYEFIDVSDEDEMAFVEVSEYVRMAAILIHGELAHPSGKSGTSSH